MDLQDVKTIIKQDENSENALQSFVTKMDGSFNLPALDENNLRVDLWNSLYLMASTSLEEKVLVNVCEALRILSREKNNLNEILDANDWMNLLKNLTGLKDVNLEFTDKKKLIVVEALKSLCNLIFHSHNAAKKCSENGLLYNLLERLKLYSNPLYPADIKYFDIKLLFVVTAVYPDSRKNLRKDKNAVYELKKFLEAIPLDENLMNEESVRLACETLRVIFNLTVHLQPREENNEEFSDLVQILRKILLLPRKATYEMLKTDAVHLLTNIPNNYYLELIPTLDCNEHVANSENMEFNGRDMAVFNFILERIRLRALNNQPNVEPSEVISPSVTVLYKGACSNRDIRKYLRSQILPPLKDVFSRPEEGTTLRNYLCRFLTSPITHLRDIVAELLFVLCKRSVKRMIKYTGYGNAAGMFAQKGLLGGNRPTDGAEFSSDSEDSETEEYAQNKDNINPVVGCYEAPHPNPLAGMTDEQKEYEAMKMINLMDALTRQGAIKPCKIDENGKPVPIEHVLELQESINQK